MQATYNPQQIEQETQQFWEEQQIFHVNEDLSKEKFYCLAMLPYPSGKLHMGHVRNYTISDVIARYQRMQNKNILHPMGWDAFGLPAENAAIQHGVAPAKWTYQNIKEMRDQFYRLGFAFDWQREIATCDPAYYRWEQWFFIQLFKKGLVYKKSAVINWDPVDQTILANEQVINGRGWRSGALVERREIPQWFLKITDYAQELLNDLEKLTGWPEEVRTMQRNWIGRSEGATVYFTVVDEESTQLEIFTTRPDTLMGVTYLAIAPQHPLAEKIAKTNPALQRFIEECRAIPTAEAIIATLDKRGRDTGLKARHPISGELIPIWAANFVVMDYGTGAVMAVPAHDQRDFEFAQKYQLPIKQVIKPLDDAFHDFTQAAFTQLGLLINSGEFNNLTSEQAFHAVTAHLSEKQLGDKKINYRLRDWSISRQRYWGTPVPIIYCDRCGAVAADEKTLPVLLPENVKFSGAASPLKNMPEFYETTCPQCGQKARRDTDTFDTFMESSWYYARYTCKNQNNAMLDDRAKYWLPVDQYVGGIEHAVMHLLYARFFHKLLRDSGLVNSDEPFTRLLTQGMVLKDGAKMSKSKGNTVDPNELIEKYGADTVRLFVIFAAPPEQSLEWSDSGVEGCYRFLKRLWNFGYQHQTLGSMRACQPFNWKMLTAEHAGIRRQIHEILQQMCYDYKRQQFNTVVSSGMKVLNLLQEFAARLPAALDEEIKAIQTVLYEGFHILLCALAPITPHITHALWQLWNFDGVIINAKFPKPANDALQSDLIELVVQVNGKLRGQITINIAADEETIKTAALNHQQIKQYIQDKTIKKIIVVPKKLVSIVVQ